MECRIGHTKKRLEVFNAGLLNARMVLMMNALEMILKTIWYRRLMQGKKYLLSLTWNAPKEAFNDINQYLFQGKSVDDMFVLNTAKYLFCGAETLQSYY